MGSALGLQFHLEVTLDMIQDWISDRQAQEQSALLAREQAASPRKQGDLQDACRTVPVRPRPVIFHGCNRRGKGHVM